LEQDARVLALVGPGRAGTAVAAGLAARGWSVSAVAGRDPAAPSTIAVAGRLGAAAASVGDAAEGATLVVLAVPDGAISDVAAQLRGVSPGALVIHLSGAVGLDALDGVPVRRAVLHPLQSLPARSDTARSESVGDLEGAWAAVAGDPEVEMLARELGMHPFVVPDADRARYHAAACIASNHLVALLGAVERIAPVPLQAFIPLVRTTVDNVEELGPRRALTGPVARGDVATIRAHLDALPDPEHELYRALAGEARRLAGRDEPELVELTG
jgi:predicted short-subunit dehydrogenase-like oxidoreductase (DUF2520 family)